MEIFDKYSVLRFSNDWGIWYYCFMERVGIIFDIDNKVNVRVQVEANVRAGVQIRSRVAKFEIETDPILKGIARRSTGIFGRTEKPKQRFVRKVRNERGMKSEPLWLTFGGPAYKNAISL